MAALSERKTKVALELIAQTPPWVIPAIFEKEIPAEVKMNAEVGKVALEKCVDFKIPVLFNVFPPEVKSSEKVIKALVKRCYGPQIPPIFEVIPFDVQRKVDDVKVALEECNRDCIPALFEVMPVGWKGDAELAKAAVKKCKEEYIPKLLEVIPIELKSNVEIVKAVRRKCAGWWTPSFFNAMPAELQTNAAVVKAFLKDCEDNKIAEVFKAIPAQVQPDGTPADLQWQAEYVATAVDSMDALNNQALDNFQESLPAHLQENKNVQSAFKRKKVMELGFFQKCKKLLWAALELSLIYRIILGPIEGAIWLQTKAGGKIANLSSQHWTNKKDCEKVQFEIFDGCKLSAAPQPFDITLPLTSVKLLIITAAFGFIARDLMSVQHDQEKRWKVRFCVGMLVYSVMMIPISFVSLVVRFVQEVSPQIQGSGGKYQCFYALMNLAPFQTNYLMYFVLFLLGGMVSHSAGIDMQMVENKICDQLSACAACRLPGVAKETFVQPLLDDDMTTGRLQQYKLRGKFMLFGLTLAAYLLVELPFIITHKIPAAGCFCPFLVLIILVTGFIFAMMNRDTLRNFRNFRLSIWLKAVQEAGWPQTLWPQTVWPQTLWPQILWPQTLWPQARWPPTLWPQTLWPQTMWPQTLWPQTLWPQTLVHEFLTLAPIYWYGGAGWFDSGMMVLVERSLWTYIIVFLTKIMTKFWSAASFINEIS